MAQVGRPKNRKNISQKRVKMMKELFILDYSNGFNITKAAEVAGICRKTYYNWMESDDDFRGTIKDINESLIDNTENELVKLINKGYFPAIKYYLTTHAKDRGYSDDTINVSVAEPIKITYINPE